MNYLVSWKIQQEAIEDIKQTFLNPDLSISKNKHITARKQNDIKYDDIVLCPFCLMSYELEKFAVRKGLRVCPCCGAKLKLSTLAEINDLHRFVEFVFNYRLNGFWNKVCLDIEQKTPNTRFNMWNTRLKYLGLNYDFWEQYKAMHGDSPEC